MDAGTVKLYGASDDLIEVDGEVRGCDEYPSTDQHFVLIGAEGGAQVRVRVWYVKRGVWAVAAAPIDEDVPMLPLTITAAERGYSALATVENVASVIVEADD